MEFKRNNPTSSEIELALKAYSMEPPFKNHADKASHILGIFRHNFAPLNLRVNTHFDPAEENCTEGIFKEIFSKLTSEQQAMIQWGLFLPERATAAYRVPLTDIDLTRQDYATVTIRKHSDDYANKSKVAHPGIIPTWFAKPIIEQARQQGRKSPFPNHQQEWKKITAFAKQEFGVRLVSNYTRKLFEAYASESTLTPAITAFLMGDKTKLAQTGHLPEIYNLNLRFLEKIVSDYQQSGLEQKLNIISPQTNEETEIERLRRELEEARTRLAQLTGS